MTRSEVRVPHRPPHTNNIEPLGALLYTEPMDLSITQALETDIPALVDILTQATAYKVQHDDMAWGTGAYTDKEVLAGMAKHPVYIARLNGEPVGTFKLQSDDDIVWADRTAQAGYIHQLAIKSGFHGQDLGQKLLEWAAVECKRQGKQFLRLDCPDSNQKLCQYYEKQGFVQVGIKSIPGFKDYTAALYEKRLD
jgi:ribosomal protein S18 acetylase RimI-like enzyme